MNYLLLAALISLVTPAHAKPLTSVRIDFVEALAPRDTTSSARYQQSYEGTIQIAAELLEKKLSKCGYVFDAKTAFYDASDALKAKELGAKTAADGAWMIVGPRRSNHYLLLVQGADQIPSVSIMASSDKVGELGARHVSVSPINSKMAKIAAQEAKKRTKKGATFVSVVSTDCSNCVDFAKAFEAAAVGMGLKKVGEVALTGEVIDSEALRSKVRPLSPDFILLPNYSKVSSTVMATFNDEAKTPVFIGGDGWGDAQYGFVQNGLDVQKVNGITVRGFPPVEKGLALFPLGRKVQKSKLKDLTYTPDLSILKIMEEAASTLCLKRPKTKEAFRTAFEQQSNKLVAAPWGVSVYELKRGELLFAKTVKQAQ